MRQILLIDFSNMVYSNYFTHQTLSTQDGFPTGVIYGCLVSILSLRKKFPGTPMVFCKDSRGATWRHKKVSYYKANRQHNTEIRDSIHKQMPIVEQFLMMFGFKQIRVEGLEADDIIGVLSFKLQHKNKVIIYSSDKDFYQLVDENIKVVRTVNMKVKTLNPQTIKDEFGVEPGEWAKMRALMGDPSDNIKPLAGVGPKTAVKMLRDGVDPSVRKFKLLQAATKRKYPSLKKKWKAIREAYLLSYIPREVDYKHFAENQKELLGMTTYVISRRPGRSEESKYRSVLLVSKLLDMLSEYEMQSLIPRRHDFFQIP